MSNEFKKNPTLTNAEKNILHIDNLRDELLPTLTMFSLMSPEQIKQIREQREKDGQTDDANRFKTSAILALQEESLNNLNHTERPEMSVPICNAISRITERLTMPDIEKRLKNVIEDALDAKDDETKQKKLIELIKITEYLKQIALTIENSEAV